MARQEQQQQEEGERWRWRREGDDGPGDNCTPPAPQRATSTAKPAQRRHRPALEFFQHAAAQSTISAPESKVTSLETLVRTLQTQEQVRSSSPVVVPAAIDPTPPESDTPAASSPPLTTRLTHADANQMEEVRRGPMVVRPRGMGHRVRAARFGA
jgi:hypothetical protein